MSSIAYAIPTVLVADESIRRRLAMSPSPVTKMLAISLPMAARFRTSIIRASANWFARATHDVDRSLRAKFVRADAVVLNGRLSRFAPLTGVTPAESLLSQGEREWVIFQPM